MARVFLCDKHHFILSCLKWWVCPLSDIYQKVNLHYYYDDETFFDRYRSETNRNIYAQYRPRLDKLNELIASHLMQKPQESQGCDQEKEKWSRFTTNVKRKIDDNNSSDRNESRPPGKRSWSHITESSTRMVKNPANSQKVCEAKSGNIFINFLIKQHQKWIIYCLITNCQSNCMNIIEKDVDKSTYNTHFLIIKFLIIGAWFPCLYIQQLLCKSVPWLVSQIRVMVTVLRRTIVPKATIIFAPKIIFCRNSSFGEVSFASP